MKSIYNHLRRFRNYLRELYIRRRLQTTKIFNGDFNREKWELIRTPVGVKAKQLIICPSCLASDKNEREMVLRKSVMARSEELGFRNAVFDLYYKCPSCGLVQCFGIAVPDHHFRLVENLRCKKGIGKVYAPEQDWVDNETIKQRLIALGYW